MQAQLLATQEAHSQVEQELAAAKVLGSDFMRQLEAAQGQLAAGERERAALGEELAAARRDAQRLQRAADQLDRARTAAAQVRCAVLCCAGRHAEPAEKSVQWQSGFPQDGLSVASFAAAAVLRGVQD